MPLVVKRRIAFGNITFYDGIEVAKTKMDRISNLAIPSWVEDVHFFLRYANFYRRFFGDFIKIAKCIASLFAKDVPFYFY